LIQPNGIEKILPVGDLTDYEQGLFKAAIPELQESITKVRSMLQYTQYVLKLLQGTNFISPSKL
jgi:hypothetical protein